MGIWTELHNNAVNPVGHCEMVSPTSAFRINRTLEMEVPLEISHFISLFLDDFGLEILYALDRAATRVIEETSGMMIYGNYDSVQSFAETVNDNLGYFGEIETLISFSKLAEELFEVANKNKLSKKDEVPTNMRTLELLKYAVQKKLEGHDGDPKNKAECFVRSLTIGNPKYYDPEALIYALSRKLDFEDELDEFVPHLQENAKIFEDFQSESFRLNNSYIAEMLRIIQFGEVGNLLNFIKNISASLRIRSPQKISPKYQDEIWKCYTTPFSLFRSDFALKYLEKPLLSYLKRAERWLEHTLIEGNFSNLEEHTEQIKLAIIAVSSCYIFGSYRLDNDSLSLEVRDASLEYLLVNQHPTASWWTDDEDIRFCALEITSMAIHALWISQTFGWQTACRRAGKWLLGEQDIYGMWYEVMPKQSSYLNVLILDSLELTQESRSVSFSLPKSMLEIECENSSSPQTKYGTININTLNYKSNYAKTKAKKKVKKKSNQTLPPKKNMAIPKNLNQYAFVIDNNSNILLRSEEDKKRLNFGHKSKAYILLYLLSAQNKLTSSDVKQAVCSPSSKPTQTIRDINRAIINKIRAAGFTNFSEDLEIILFSPEKIYQSIIPVKTFDDFEADDLRVKEEIVNDPNENKYTDE